MKTSNVVVREKLGRRTPKPITEARELITRKEAAAILGCHVDTVKKLEQRRGGTLEIRRLHPSGRSVYYRLADVMAIVGPGSIPRPARLQS
ncbi:helix-turn-helix domain-containing protein [Bradyrhizobium canariense]|uniref:helix-turn-helix domain-containing protein n=1 Tax=Bradyrhizobium canariense TaxID=255045 RepID=UPI0011776B43|nr:helix-turn-helix domain-containing protein [Bradyrhizobium canariense]